MAAEEKWVSVFSRDPLAEEDWAFLWFAHSDCAEDYAKENVTDNRDIALQVASRSETDGECEICSDLSHEERQGRRQRMFDSGEIHMPVA